ALRHVETTGRNEAALAQRFRDAAGASAPPTNPITPEQLAARVTQVQRYGDAARGEAIFRRQDTSCFKCHAIQGAGGQLGPDLGSIGASSPVDYLILSMLEPNKQIKDGYSSVIITTKGNDVYSGIKVSQDERQMILRDAVQDRIVVPLDQVKSERPGGSLMPTGLIEPLPAQEQLDLIRFLCELGKPGAYGSGSGAPGLVRRWRVLLPQAAEKLVRDASALTSPQRSAALPWAAAYSLVSGVLPPDTMAADGQQIAFAKAEIDVTTPGRIGFNVGAVKGLSLWVDGTPVDVAPDVTIDLQVGVHTLTFRVDVAERGEGLRVEVRDLPGSGAHARPVGGR
ncbi:MAG: hypothetical protein WBD40_22015, partial [Tepidisphaeraceae bacterium]